MMMLHPWGLEASSSSYSVLGELTVSGSRFCICWQLSGDLSSFVIPKCSSSPFKLLEPNRKNELWKETCFEFFIRPKGQERYWEFNLSPSGKWNLYSLAKYRDELVPSKDLIDGEVSVDGSNQLYKITASLNAPELAKSPFMYNLTCVLQCAGQKTLFFAPRHPKTKPDFHDPSCFLNYE
ncbi:MAG: hypothetical protein N2578_07675 [Bdellovibrionaceae bacterium]|nr:hypothetical protein [Pseudobdellovibrionaceae bacterium]